MAPSHDILDKVVKKMDDIIGTEENQKKIKAALESASDPAQKEEAEEVDANLTEEGHVDREFESLVDFPTLGSNTEIILFVILFPIRFLMHWTIPDVRVLDSHGNPVGDLGTAFVAVISCLIWLIVGSYAMVASLEALATLMNVPDAVVGVTVSAAGTSLPNYVASKMAAEQGFGVRVTPDFVISIGKCLTSSLATNRIWPSQMLLEAIRSISWSGLGSHGGFTPVLEPASNHIMI